MPVIDDLQVRILREMTNPASFRWDVRESYASIGKTLGVDAETVRKRVKQAQELGLVQSWRLLPNPDVLGCESAGFHFDVDDESRKPALIEQITQVDGVVLIMDFHGRALRVVLYCETEQDVSRRIHLVSSVAAAQNLVRWSGGIPPSDAVLTKTDWRVVKALRKDPRRRLTAVAGELGISARTVKRRLAGMTAAKAFYIVPNHRGGGYTGAVSTYLISYADEKKRRTVDREILKRLARMVFSSTTTKGFSMFTCVCDNLSEAESIHRWVEGLDGVEAVRMDILRGNLLVDEWLDGEIERRAG